MADSGVNEHTPLVSGVDALRRRGTRRIKADKLLSKSGASGLLKRVKSKMEERGGGQNRGTAGIDKVCKELEQKEKNTSRFFWVAIFFIVNHIVGGAIVLRFLEGWSFYDCLYFCIVTTTTVGYGDITPGNPFSKLFVIYFVVVSIGLISTMLAYLVGLLLDQQEQLLLSTVLDEDEEGEDIEEMQMNDYAIDMMEERDPSSINDRIINATKRLDLSDYYELGFATAFLGVVLAIGVLVFYKMENLSLLDSIYVTIISASTVGFGDYEPTKNATKIIMTIWLCFSTIAVAKLVADFTDASVKAKQRDVSRRLLTASMTMESFKMMDLDNDQSVDKCEFVTEMLIRSGKVERKDVDTILLRFEQLDKDRSGSITAGDLL